MSDLNSSTSVKNNLCKDQGLKFSVPWKTTEDEKVDLSERNDSGFAEPMISRKFEDPISPGTEVCASLPEDSSLSDSSFVNDLVMCREDNPISVLNSQSSKYCVSDETDKALFVNKLNCTKSRPLESPPIKCNSDKLNTSTNCKNKSSTNFSIFGQLLNKKQNNVAGSRDSGSSNNYSVSQSSSSNVPKSDGTDTNEGAQKPQMKTKLKSIWNNVKYGWRMKREVNLKIDRATWILGQCYHSKLNEDVSFIQDVSEQLRLDLLSKIWLTYRINFPTIPGTTLITDSGWGCMLRCGQMMMAQAFVCHFLQRDWRISSHHPEDKNQIYKTILRWFGDSLSDNSPFSVHHLVSLGENYGRKAGDWYGPTHAAHVLRDALGKAKEHHPQLQQLCMYVASDGIVFKQDVMDLCLNSTDESAQPTSDFETLSMTELQNKPLDDFTKDSESADFVKVDPRIGDDFKSSDDPCLSYSEFGPPSYNYVNPTWKSLILFVSVRLGNDKINPFYIPCLKSLLAYENCIGIIGGRPKHALYFIGWQDDKIIHMDPHSCQPAIDVEKEDFIEKSFHSSSVRMMAFSDMDPSCSIGFYFRELEEFQIFIEKFSEITAPLKRNLEYPVFALADGKRIEVEGPSYLEEKDMYPPLRTDFDDINDDDYILL